MGVSEKVAGFLGSRGLNLRADDIDELRAILATADPEQYDAIAGAAWETVAQIVNDPAYEGDAELPESD